ncbi:MAG: hypothetical protein HYY13_12815 [Nitrospirae bacterium]|nr:hypothetical protein [Nitrospirota bacterium]
MAQRVGEGLSQVDAVAQLLHRARQVVNAEAPLDGVEGLRPGENARPRGRRAAEAGDGPDTIVSLRRGRTPAADGDPADAQRAREAVGRLEREGVDRSRIEGLQFNADRVRDLVIAARRPVSGLLERTRRDQEEAEQEALEQPREALPLPQGVRQQIRETSRFGVRSEEALPRAERNPAVRGEVAERLRAVEATPPEVREFREEVDPELRAQERVQEEVVTSHRAETDREMGERERTERARIEREDDTDRLRRDEDQVRERERQNRVETPDPRRLQEVLQEFVASPNLHENVTGMGDIRPRQGRLGPA